ncbi:MAG: amidohydrolase [Chitinophagia bacterium]|nr:amidohydrolase [Chitinophagia bacterium]
MQNSLLVYPLQIPLEWENKTGNKTAIEVYLANIQPEKHIVILPEMFTTGFSMQPETFAEPMDGDTVNWLKRLSADHKCIITGSVMIEEEGRYYNRLLWVQPTGTVYHYDKRHLFGYANEDRHYTPGNKKLITSVGGWRICTMICYDLRFPVWSRYTPDAPYDVLIYLANWPQKRSFAWQTLLRARAIENQCYVIGVNRVGTDPQGNTYSGYSACIDPMGNTIWECADATAMPSLSLDKELLLTTRAKLPFLNDADGFVVV